MKNKTPSPSSSASSSRRVTPVKVNKPPVKRQLFANNKRARREHEFQELLRKHANGKNTGRDPFENNPNAFARARAALGTGNYTKAQREALKTWSQSSPESWTSGKLKKTNRNINNNISSVKYPNKATKKRARKLGIPLRYIPNWIENDVNGANRANTDPENRDPSIPHTEPYTEANILKKIANAEKARAKANANAKAAKAKMPNLKKRAKALKVSLTKPWRFPMGLPQKKYVYKSVNELENNIANAEKAKVREERRKQVGERIKKKQAAAKTRAKAKREYEREYEREYGRKPSVNTKKWRNATRGFILKNKPKPKKKAAPKKKTKAAAPNAQNKRNRAYIAKEVRGIMSRVKKAAAPPKKKAAAAPKKRVAQKGKTKSSYDKNVRAYAKKLGIKISYRVPRKEGQKKASGLFYTTNNLEKKIRNRLAEQGNVANIANIRARIKGNNLTPGNKNYIAKEVKGIMNRVIAKGTAKSKKRKAAAPTANTRKPKRVNPAMNIVAGMKKNSEKKKAEEKRFLERLQQKQYEQYKKQQSNLQKKHVNSALRHEFGNNVNMVRGLNQYGSAAPWRHDGIWRQVFPR